MIFDDCEAHVLDWLAQLPASHERSMNSNEAAAWFDDWMAIDAKNEEIDRAEKWREPTASEAMSKRSELARLRTERTALFLRMGLDANGKAVNTQVAPVVVGSASGGSESDKAAQAKPLQRNAAQDSAILLKIKELGHDPLALPKNPNGKPGVKAAVRTALSRDSLFVGSTIFNKAWERLTARADIAIRG